MNRDPARIGLTPADNAGADLRARCAELARQWTVTVDETSETESSLIAYGRRGADPVVLKVLKAPGDEWRSGEVLSAFGGRGIVRALDHAEGAVLLERIVPGTALVDLTRSGRDDDATVVLAEVIGAMSPGAPPSWCPTVGDWARAFDWYLRGGDAQIPRPLVERARAIYTELAATQRVTRLLHGDLHHYNILADRRGRWVGIDPKGVVGEVEYETGAALRNPVERPELLAATETIEKRIATLSSRLDLDADRMLRWAYAQAVLSAIWLVEDGYVIGSDTVPLTLVRSLEPLL